MSAEILRLERIVNAMRIGVARLGSAIRVVSNRVDGLQALLDSERDFSSELCRRISSLEGPPEPDEVPEPPPKKSRR